MAISNAGQFGLLLWKHWLLQKRRPIVTTFLLILPVLLSVFLVLTRMAADATFEPSSTIWDSFEASTSFPSNLTLPKAKDVSTPVTLSNWTLVFSPNTSKAAIRMTKSVAGMLDAFSIGKIICTLSASSHTRKSIITDMFWLVWMRANIVTLSK